MNNYQKMVDWMGDRQRKYADGLALFRRVGRPQRLERCIHFLESGSDQARIGMLEGCIRDTIRGIEIEPRLYPEAYKPYLGIQTIDTTAARAEASEKEKLMAHHSEIITAIQNQLRELEERHEDSKPDYSELQGQLEAHEETLRQLTRDVEELYKPGVKIVNKADLPAKQRIANARISEIVPLMAALHAELSDTSLTDTDRQQRAEQLCKLDDERRALWKQIDQWAEGKVEDPDPQPEQTPLQEGAKKARRIQRIKANMVYARKKLSEAEAEGNDTAAARIRERMANYEKEILQLSSDIQ